VNYGPLTEKWLWLSSNCSVKDSNCARCQQRWRLKWCYVWIPRQQCQIVGPPAVIPNKTMWFLHARITGWSQRMTDDVTYVVVMQYSSGASLIYIFTVFQSINRGCLSSRATSRL